MSSIFRLLFISIFLCLSQALFAEPDPVNPTPPTKETNPLPDQKFNENLFENRPNYPHPPDNQRLIQEQKEQEQAEADRQAKCKKEKEEGEKKGCTPFDEKYQGKRGDTTIPMSPYPDQNAKAKKDDCGCNKKGPGHKKKKSCKKPVCPPCNEPGLTQWNATPPRPDSDYIHVTSDDVMPCTCPMNRPAMKGAAEGIDVGLNLDVILWSAEESGLAVAASGVPTVSNTQRPNGVYYYPKMKTITPGFKVGVDVFFIHDQWSFNADYTRFINSNRVSEFANDNITNELVIFFPGEITLPWGLKANDGASQWQLHFNNINADLGRYYKNSDWLSIRTFYGLQASWQDQYLDVTYFYNVNQIEIENVVDMEIKYIGFGPRAGSEIDFRIWETLSLYGQLSLAGLWSNFQLSSVNTIRVANTQEAFTFNYSFGDQMRMIAPTTDLQLGLRYYRYFLNDAFRASGQIYWQLQYWWGQNRFNSVYENGSKGDLSLQGLSIRVQLDF
ncbi:MAG: hypothetical protein S4CHLAM102_05390 [Chlamydiia bacterium]|nr:hypothetical protein [Chlamydiia bacterium]